MTDEKQVSGRCIWEEAKETLMDVMGKVYPNKKKISLES
jgi:hypothetical protein